MSLIQLGLSKGLRGTENLFQKTSLTVKKKKLLQAKRRSHHLVLYWWEIWGRSMDY